jgi:dolichol-phosphate mannosyltransferase
MIHVVLPAYNEAEAIPRLLDRFRCSRHNFPFPITIIVVDDGSADGTAEAAEAADVGFPVKVIRHPANRGLHGALDTGLRAALAQSTPSDWIVTMDADDTHPPDLIERMVLGTTDADVVIASRFRHGAEWHGLSWDRRLFSHGVSWMFRVAWPMRGVRDYTCGFRAYRASLLQRAYEHWGDQFITERSFACMPDVLWKISTLRPRFAEVPLRLYYDRKPGASKMDVGRTIRRTLVLLAKRRTGWTSASKRS